ncbi:putative chitin synthase 2 [Lactarius akahatsu]|uniref:Chitin synthase n=1 Tax=Lactarius akahatsu TaxID=416441 RepID=A0AAD4Q592_9AGAM|nr:putative chitin synthase 2 [Lactarius akahatsu]
MPYQEQSPRPLRDPTPSFPFHTLSPPPPGPPPLQRQVVDIVKDGRQKINSRMPSAIMAHPETIATNMVNGKPVSVHVYEYTTESTRSRLRTQRGIVLVQIIFCLKEKNEKKINSHHWFFNAFGHILQPNTCVLLDIGIRPGSSLIYHLWKGFEINSKVGDACGEIVAFEGKYGQTLLNPLLAAQNFEYKMSNILDKPSGSVFGYITMLPGALSVYRYIALQNDSRGEVPSRKYILGEMLACHSTEFHLFAPNNIHSTERAQILCWELVSRRSESWVLHYVKSAYAVTDTPDQVPELVSQRRGCPNGSFFVAIHGADKFHYIYRSSHSFDKPLHGACDTEWLKAHPVVKWTLTM